MISNYFVFLFSVRTPDDEGLLLPNAESVSSKSAAVDGQVGLAMPNLSEKSVESGAGDTNSQIRGVLGKDAGSQKGPGRGKLRNPMDGDGGGGQSMGGVGNERPRSRGGKNNSNRQTASAVGLNASGDMGGGQRNVQGQHRKSIQMLHGGNDNDNRMDHDQDMYTNLFQGFSGVGGGPPGASDVVDQGMNFDNDTDNMVSQGEVFSLSYG